MMKYVVIGCAIHYNQIIRYLTFDSRDEAFNFLIKDAQDTYEEEYNNSDNEKKELSDLTINYDESACFSSHDGKYKWVWSIVKTE